MHGQSATSACSPSPFEEIVEDVGKAFPAWRRVLAVPTGASLAASLLIGLGLFPIGAILIVFFSFVWIGEDFLRLVQFFEPFLHLGFFGAAVHVRMELAREAAIGLLDVVRRGRLGKTENLIIVAWCGRHEVQTERDG